MSEHTPGPWELYESSSEWDDTEFYGDISDASGRRIVADFGYRGASIPYWEQRANAKLLCAAPDLLASAEEALEALIRTHPHPRVLCRQLINGVLERRLNAISPEVFDPSGRVRALLSLTAAIAKASH